MRAVFDLVLSPPPLEAYEDVETWWRAHQEATRALEAPVDRAIAGATRVDRLGLAFAGGYRAALEALLPALPREQLASLAATEAGGAHPRAIFTRLTPLEAATDGFDLTGEKQWVTLGKDGGALLVVAALPERDPPAAHPELRVVHVDASADGVHLEPLPEMSMIPEIPHARVKLEHVRVRPEAVLPGDGYSDYLKPFRTIEDLHVHAALLAWLGSLARRGGAAHPVVERILATLAATRALALDGDAKAPATHLALAGVLEQTTAIVREMEPVIERIGGELSERWNRDRPLLTVAGRARARRREAAWAKLEAISLEANFSA